jgi:serine O-acetyltransferase
MDITFLQQVVTYKTQNQTMLPDANKVRKFVTDVFETMFIAKDRNDNNVFEVEAGFKKLHILLADLIAEVLNDTKQSTKGADIFFGALPEIYSKLVFDAEALYKADPAASSLQEIFIAYPGFFAIATHRIAHQLHKQQIPLLPRVISEYAHSRTGIDIHPGATIGNAFAIDHGTGIVIGETTNIGNNVKIYQGVTLGALSVVKENASTKRHPTIQDNVVIYSGATILGGETIVGHDSVVGGNVWLTKSVLPYSIVYHQAEVVVQDKKTFKEPIDYFI